VKERLVTLGLAACALGLFWILFVPTPHTLESAPRPLTTGEDVEGYAAVSRWLGASGVPTATLHQRFTHLGDPALGPGTGNLLVTTLPYDIALHPDEYAALDAWVAQGNTVLVLAALDDTPLWSAVSANFVPQLQKLTALQFAARQQPATGAVAQATAGLRAALTPGGLAIELRPTGHIGLLDGVLRLATRTPLPSTQWQAQALDAAPVLALARRTDDAEPVLWLKGRGSGALIVSAYASLFSNAVIGSADNARLLSNLVAWSLAHGGRVIFDDAHQGAVDEYDPERFFADPRLHRTLLWLLALWLAWVLAAQPLRAAAPHAGTLDEAAMLRTTAGFLAGVLRPVAAAQWLFEEFFARLRRRHGLPCTAAPPWDWLAAHAGVRSTALTELRALYERTQAGQRISLLRLQRIVSQISGQLS